jgi:hypothetical protein
MPSDTRENAVSLTRPFQFRAPQTPTSLLQGLKMYSWNSEKSSFNLLKEGKFLLCSCWILLLLFCPDPFLWFCSNIRINSYNSDLSPSAQFGGGGGRNLRCEGCWAVLKSHRTWCSLRSWTVLLSLDVDVSPVCNGIMFRVKNVGNVERFFESKWLTQGAEPFLRICYVLS